MSYDYEDEDHSDGCSIEPEIITCNKCDKIIELPKQDGRTEYYEHKDTLHGAWCRECGRVFCDECANWQKDEEYNTVCFECYNRERRTRIDLSIHKAIIFACRKHDKQYRKSTDIPYISHIMEVMQILIDTGCSNEVVIAGILHDTLEDTKTTPEEIEKIFGKRVLSIVKSETEDKSKEWIDRKLETIAHMRSASDEVKLVCCADKLSNMRSIYSDLKTIGEKVWERFNADKENIKRYYENIHAALFDISDTEMYNELEILIDDVFNLDWSSYGKED